MTERITVVSGIPPGDSGTGSMMRQIISKSAASGIPMRFVYRARPSKPFRHLLRAGKWREGLLALAPYAAGSLRFAVASLLLLAFGHGKLLIMHPQTLGFRRTVQLIRRFRPGKVYIYMLDSSYFCIRSYNYIPHEAAPCTRCLGGHFENQAEQGCKPFPVKDAAAGDYTRALFDLVRAGHVKLLAQNERQKELILRHFGEQASVHIVGLWGEEWTEPFDEWERRQAAEEDKALAARNGPILIHSFYVAAKGADWFIALARNSPDLEFLCPFPRARSISDPPANMTFRPMTWETGLREAMAASRMVMVPSLWSATIEGALIKSMVTNDRVAILENDSAFQAELPDEAILRLSGDPVEGARQLKVALDAGWAPDAFIRRKWIRDFRKFNERFFENIFDIIGGGQALSKPSFKGKEAVEA
jgi:hypothetical protein